MSDVDRQIVRSDAVLSGSRERRMAARRRSRTATDVARRVGLAAAADVAILLAVLVVGWIVPIGMGGVLLSAAAMVLVTSLILLVNLTPAPRAEQLAQVPLKALPARTEQWLETQRPALPAPAQTLLDGIGVRLETLSPQLAALDEGQPVAGEVRTLLGEQLPELIRGYAKVPVPLRGVERNGRSPDTQLADALKLIDREIGEMSEQIAQGDLDSLATRGRFLEIKYQGDGST